MFWLYFLLANADWSNLYINGALPFAGTVSSLSIGYFIWYVEAVFS